MINNKLPRLHLEADKNSLMVQLLERSHPECDDYWDGNWINTQVTVSAGGFHGSFEASLRSEDFVGFRAGLRLAYAALGTEIPSLAVEFSTIEEQLAIQVRSSRSGHFVAKCVVMDEAGAGSRLEFVVLFDQTYLLTLLRDLDLIVAAFPVKGKPPH